MPRFKGNNSLKAREMLIERNVYTSYALAELRKVSGPKLETIQIKDFQKDEKLFVGRVDQQHNPIFINPRYLKSIGDPSGRQNKTAINFVADAFGDMKKKFDKALRTGRISSNSIALSELAAKKAYVDPLKQYNDFIKGKTAEFKGFAKRKGRLKTIKDFDSFVNVFLEFIDSTAKRVPFTKSMFLLTKEVSVLSSGLAIEVYEGNYGSDKEKIELFYRHSNFEYLKNLAYAHGFVIDKHIPWRLIADMNSPQMTPYINESFKIPGIGAGSVLFLAFNKTYFDDINSLARIMVDFYNTIAVHRPRTVIREPSATSSPNSAKTVFAKCEKKRTIRRKRTTVREVIASHTNAFWLNVYAKIRNAETGLRYGDGTLSVITKNSIDLINSLDSATAMRYITSKFDNVEHFEGSLFHDITRIHMRKDPTATGTSVDETVLRSVQASNFVIY